MLKTSTLPEQLKAYSLLAGSFLATSLAHAQVHYTDVIPDKELGGVNPGGFPHSWIDTLDLNNDGVYDFKLTVSMYGMPSANEVLFREKIDGSLNPLNAVISYTVEYLPVPLKLDTCDSIPPPYLYGFNQAFFAYQSANAVGYFWQNVHDKYVGLSFRIGNETHYGWVRLDVNTAAPYPNIVIKDYAYEATADESISVCDTGTGQPDHVASIDLQKSISIYPNPSDGKCMIKLSQPISGEMKMEVNDELGNLVFDQAIPPRQTNDELLFDFSALTPGIYLIQLKSSEATLTKKWIKH